MTALKATENKIDKAVKYATQQVGMEANRQMKKQIKGGHKRGTPTPSAPDNPPTNITGYLRRSIRASRVTGFEGRYQVTVGPYANYARSLEYGNPRWRSGVKYPFVEPTAKLLSENNYARNIYFRAISSALRK